MIIQIEVDNHIVQYNKLKDAEKLNLRAYFDDNPDVYILDMEDGSYWTKTLLSKSDEPKDIRIDYNLDMFLYGSTFVYVSDYAVVVDENGNYIKILDYLPSSYIHDYKYTGGVEMWFLDQYEAMVLDECNEYSAELCQTIINLWKGDTLVLIGDSWFDLLSHLPVYEGKNVYWEKELQNPGVVEAIQGKKTIFISNGLPHAETMERYEKGVMSYDEVMAFTYMFSNQQSLGEDYPELNFAVIDGYYSNLGLFALYGKINNMARYVKYKGYIPIIHITKSDRSMYSDNDGDDIWGKFFNQPEGYGYEDIRNAKNVCYLPGFYPGTIQENIMGGFSKGTTLSWPIGMYNDKVRDLINEKQRLFLPYPDETLGVIARGTDYVNAKLHNHPIHATKEMLAEKIDEKLKEQENLKYVYIATEDASYCEYFKNRYGNQVYFTDQKRYVTKANELLTEHHSNDENKSDGYTLGTDYILSISLLAMCNSLIASGGCGGLGEALRQNEGKYKDVYVFDLGTNK